MKTYQYRPIILALMLAAVLMVGLPSGALAQCGGGGGGSGSGSMGSMHDQHMGSSSMGSMHDQQMGSSGQMGSGQMGRYGSQAPVQTGPNAVTPGYANPQNPGGYGSDHNGHQH